MGREKVEAERAAKLVELRKKYLDRKGIISKAGTPTKVKLVGRDKVEAERRKKLEELREKYLAKKREVTKSIRPTARKTNTESTKKSDSKLASVVKRPPMSKRGDSKLASVVKRQPMSKRGDSKLASVVKKPPMSKRGDSKIASVVKRSSGVVKKKTSIPEGRSINMKVPKKKILTPTKSVRPIARSTTVDPKTKKNYFVDKKKGNVMVRVYPNITPTLFGNMTAKQIDALNLPSRNSKKYIVDFNQRKELTFIKKK